MVLAPSMHMSPSFVRISKPGGRCAASSPARTAFFGLSSPTIIATSAIQHHAACCNSSRIFSNTVSGLLPLASTSIKPPASLPEKINQRTGLLLISFQPLSHHRLAIVLTNHQRFPIQITDSGDARRPGTRVIQSPAFGAHTSPRDTRDNYIVINHEMNHHLARFNSFSSSTRTSACCRVLGYPSRIRPVRAIRLGQAFPHQLVHQLIGHQRTRFHAGFNRPADLITPRDVVAQHIAARDLRNPENGRPGTSTGSLSPIPGDQTGPPLCRRAVRVRASAPRLTVLANT